MGINYYRNKYQDGAGWPQIPLRQSREGCTSVLVLSVVSATYIMENRVRIPVTMNQNTSTGRPASLAEYANPQASRTNTASYDRKTTSA